MTVLKIRIDAPPFQEILSDGAVLVLLAYEDLKGLQYVGKTIIEDVTKTLVDSPSRISMINTIYTNRLATEDLGFRGDNKYMRNKKRYYSLALWPLSPVRLLRG